MSVETYHKLAVYREAVNRMLIGGNSLASALISMDIMPDHIKSIEEAMKLHGEGKLTYIQYECWLCWFSMMRARELLRLVGEQE